LTLQKYSFFYSCKQKFMKIFVVYYKYLIIKLIILLQGM